VTTAEIELRFTHRNSELVRLGMKTCTTRRSCHGKVGDSFRVGGERYEIVALLPTNLREAAEVFYRAEGEPSPTYFLEEWARLYGENPDRIDVKQPVHVHLFGRPPLPARSIQGEE
jgi:hypothetical protein